MNYKLGIGPMSLNVVDACIGYANNHNTNISLIPSRRQVEHIGGYVNSWTTQSFSRYVKERSNKVYLKRDHGGPGQGEFDDDGIISLNSDCDYLDAIHIDPWKKVKEFEEGCQLTKQLIEYCYQRNNNIIFEVGTEQAIFSYTSQQLNHLLSFLRKSLPGNIFNQIRFGVIQSGTALKENHNTGTYDERRLKEMIDICKSFNLLSKEHNGDYLDANLIKSKFNLGLDSINIAPEFGQIETKIYLSEIQDKQMFELFFKLCYESNRWVKWVGQDFDPFNNKEELINICGHYVFSNQTFKEEIKSRLDKDIDNKVQDAIKKKIDELR